MKRLLLLMKMLQLELGVEVLLSWNGESRVRGSGGGEEKRVHPWAMVVGLGLG